MRGSTWVESPSEAGPHPQTPQNSSVQHKSKAHSICACLALMASLQSFLPAPCTRQFIKRIASTHIHSFSSQQPTLDCSLMPLCCGSILLLTLVFILCFSHLLCPLDLMVGIVVPTEFPSIELYFTQIFCFRPPWLNLALISPHVDSATMDMTPVLVNFPWAALEHGHT